MDKSKLCAADVKKAENEKYISILTTSREFGFIDKTFYSYINPNIPLYSTNMDDYVILSNSAFTTNEINKLPKSIREKLWCNWLFVLNVPNTLNPALTTNKLREQVFNNNFLSYMYTECSIGANYCVYFGFLPRLDNKKIDGSHKKCRISANTIWPRKLYLQMYLNDECRSVLCEKPCRNWRVTYRNQKEYILCFSKIDWTQVELIMGNLWLSSDKTKQISLMKEPRTCKICSQCYKCSISFTFCNKHKKCSHKSRNVSFDQINKLVDNIVLTNNKIYK